MATLSGIQLSWVAPTLLGGDTFEQINAARRLTAAGGAYTRVAIISAIAVLTWTDYSVASGVQYDYVISTVVLRSGVPVESPASAPVTASCTFANQWLQKVADPSAYLQFPSNDRAVPLAQEQTSSFGWGQRLPTLYVGEALARHWTLTSAPQVGAPLDMTLWTAIEAFVDAQREEAAVFLYRNGNTAEVAYVTLSAEAPQVGGGGVTADRPAQRADKIGYYTVTLDLAETNYVAPTV